MGSENGPSPFVRPYAVTGGRTESHADLAIEALVTTTDRGWRSLHSLVPEYEQVCRLCAEFKSVAEIAALLKMPLGVVRVLLSDLADQGKIRVYGTGTGHGPGRPDRALLERVLSGLRRL